ncbi:single-stranded DNA-binding protein [Microbacterium sp.]|uniref:single-stranded DNA-binding protein n=1 Tax=Microbacterium sp. TaxID=51671 RepID=UPI002810C11D|nr:single-stranded DNA-binding protein [Microbacterium sp.]
MNDTVTIRGNVGGDPVKSTTPGGVSVVHFRVASSSGYWDRRTGSWVEGGTNWYAVSAFRQLADHAKASLRSGDAVIVTGTLKLREWESNGKRGFSADLDADSIGHDLRWGTSAFVRVPRPSAQSAQPAADGRPSAADPADPTRDEMAPEGESEAQFGQEPSPDERRTWDVAGLEPVEPDGDREEDTTYASA